MYKKISIIVILITGIMTFGIISIASADFTEVYSTDFEGDFSSKWSSTSSALGVNSTYHGNFKSQDQTTLTLTDLPSHSQLSLEFDLYLFNSWDGNNTNYGPDYFSLSGDVTGSWTFTNHQPEGQTYPGTPDNIIGSGVSATHIYRGLDPTGSGDSFLIKHSDSTFTVTFGGPTSQTDEWWGIDNVRVSINSTNTPESSIQNDDAKVTELYFIRKTDSGPVEIKEIGYGEPFYIKAEYNSEPQESMKTVTLNWGEGPGKPIIVVKQPIGKDKKIIFLSNAIYAKRPE